MDIDKDTVQTIETFARSLFAKSNIPIPPTSDSLLQRIKRANYQALARREALAAKKRLPSPEGYAWKLENDTLFPHIITKLPAPACN